MMATPRAMGSSGSLRGSLVDLGGTAGLGFFGPVGFLGILVLQSGGFCLRFLFGQVHRGRPLGFSVGLVFDDLPSVLPNPQFIGRQANVAHLEAYPGHYRTLSPVYDLINPGWISNCTSAKSSGWEVRLTAFGEHPDFKPKGAVAYAAAPNIL